MQKKKKGEEEEEEKTNPYSRLFTLPLDYVSPWIRHDAIFSSLLQNSLSREQPVPIFLAGKKSSSVRTTQEISF